MAIIENKRIYDHSKSEIPKLTKDLNDLIESEKELIKTNKALSDSLQTVKKTSDGKEAKELVETTEKLTKSTKDLTDAQKNEIKIKNQLEKAQQDLINSENAEAIELEKLKLQKKDQIKFNKDLAQKEIDLEKGYRTTEKTIKNLKSANKLLIEERDNLNLTTKEGKKRQEELNEKIEENGKFINANKTGHEGLSGAINQALPGMSNMAAGFKQMTLAALRFIATPIGAVIAAIVVVFKLLQGAFTRSLSSQEKLNKITGKLSAAFNLILDALIPVVEFILDEVLKAFDAMGSAVVFVIEKLEKWGIISEETSKKVKGALDSNTKAADDLASAERRLVEADIALQKSQLKYLTLQEAQRQIRDDTNKSIEERIEANEELGRILTEQAATERIHALAVLKIARQRQQVNGESVESIREIGEAEIKLLEITERVEAQRSEQLVNAVALNKEREEEIELLKEIAEQREAHLTQEIEASTISADIKRRDKEQFLKDQEEITASFTENQKKQQEEAVRSAEAFLILANNIRDVGIQAGHELGTLMAQGLLTFKEFGKILLRSTLDLIQKQINVYLVAILAREIASKSFAGIVTAAILGGIINGALQAAKAGIANFNEGTEYVPGIGNKDTVAAILTPGERVVPAEINKRLGGIPNSELPNLLNKQDNNMMLAGLLMKGNQNGNDMIELLSRLGLVYKKGNENYIERASGKIERFI